MISLDADYLALKPYLEAECKRRKLDFQFTELNPNGWGDLMFISELTGIHNVEIKQAGEYIGDVDHLINQIRAQAEMSDHLWLFIYGEMRRAEDGNSYSLRYDKGRESWASKAGLDTGWVEEYTRRYHRVNFTAQRKILWRMREAGVQVIEVRNLEELASELCLLYESAQTEGATWSRLIKEKFYVREDEKPKQALALTLMGVAHARWGEEYALAAADVYSNFSAFYSALVDNVHNISIIPLRSSKRTIGNAAAIAMRKALGIETE